MVAILPIVIVIVIFVIIAFKKDKIIPILTELFVDAFISIIFLGVIGIWWKIPEAWVVVLWLIGMAVLFFAHIARNAEGKGGS